MKLVEQHIIKPNNPYFREIDELCLKSKNLYNSCLYLIKQEYKNNNVSVVNKLHHLMKSSEQYTALPAKVSSSVLLLVEKNYKSFFQLLKKKSGDIHPHEPKYLNKITGRFICSYTNQAISKKVFKVSNKIKLSKTNIEFKTKITNFNNIDCVRLIPKCGYYVIELVYTVYDVKLKENNNKYVAIDLGINNLATIVSNVKEIKPLIINGKPLKSINQYYNKKKSKIASILEKKNKKKTSKKLNNLNLKRTNKINNYLHKSSKKIITILLENNINTLIVGNNVNWKQEVKLGKKNNQNFINIPHSRFIQMLKYKCERSGINFILTEESYTSKASFLDLDEIPRYNKKTTKTYQFSGYRKSRGMYVSKTTGKKINADVNGAYNILRKVIPNIITCDGIEGIGVCPKIIKILKK